jgi:uncharacterized protein
LKEEAIMKRKLLALVMALGVVGAVVAEEMNTPRQLKWTDLRVRVEFEDPFEKLTEDQLSRLSIYARIKAMQERVPHKISNGMQKEADEAEKSLRKEGINIEGLLARREEIKQLRTKRAGAMNKKLDGVNIKMPGYALALEYDGKKVTEFLLVPWVGACIHTPPPPANQIVYVKLDKGIEVKNRYQPVWVTGAVSVGALQKNLFLVDGSADISIGYSISGAKVEAYRKDKTKESS